MFCPVMNGLKGIPVLLFYQQKVGENITLNEVYLKKIKDKAWTLTN
jgi:hypothetical protein